MPIKINFTKEQELKIINLHKNLERAKDIGHKFNVSATKIQKILRKNNISLDISRRRKLLFKAGKIKSKKIKFSNGQINTIINMYLNRLIGALEISKKFRVSEPTILKLLKENDVKIDSKKRFKLLSKKGKLNDRGAIKFSESQKIEVVRLYEDDLLSARKIGRIFGVSESPIRKILKKHNVDMDIKMRSRILWDNVKIKHWRKKKFTEKEKKNIINDYNNSSMWIKDICKKYNISRATLNRFLKEENKLMPLGERRRIFYKKGFYNSWCKGLTKETNASVKRVSDKLKGLERSYETRKKFSIAKQGINPKDWEKFVSREPYDQGWTDKFKRAIRKRDFQICMLCGIHREKLRRALDVHHINYQKLDSFFQNCISLCQSCHSKTNFNREHWKKFFQSLLAEKYGYKYSETGEIIFTIKKES